MSIHPSIKQRDFLKAAQLFNWATKEHYLTWFTGSTERSRRVEVLLPRLVKSGKLRCVKYEHKNLYIVPRLARDHEYQIEHGLGVTEGLVRFWRSDMTAEIIPERRFQGYGVRPEWGMVLGKNVLLYEYCTKDNARRLNVLSFKLNAYSKFIKENYTVLFVMQITRDEVREKIAKLKPEGRFLFTDYETFKSVPIGEQLTSGIYLWEDLKEYPLRHA